MIFFSKFILNCAEKHLAQQFLPVSPYVGGAQGFVWPVGNLTAIKVGSGHSSRVTERRRG